MKRNLAIMEKLCGNVGILVVQFYETKHNSQATTINKPKKIERMRCKGGENNSFGEVY
jgi:hypothetical protein